MCNGCYMRSSLITKMQQVLIPVANGSEEIEVVTIADILRRAKVDVVIASVEKSMRVLTSQGTKIVADKLIGSAAESIYDLIILPVRHRKCFIYFLKLKLHSLLLLILESRFL